MKIGINGRALAVEEPGGAVQTGRKIAHGLSETIPDTTLYGHERLQQIIPNARVRSPLYPVNSLLSGVVWERTVLPMAAVRDGIDVLYCPNTNAPMTPTPFATVLVIHDMGAERGYQSRLQRAYRRATLSPAAKYADAIVTVSEFSKSEIVEILDVTPSKVWVVYPGVDEIFLGDGTGSRTELPEKYVLFVGSMNPRKNIRRTVKAFQQARRHYAFSHKLVLIGPGSSLSFGDDDLNITGEHVFTNGFVSESELKYAYENATLLLFPSHYEGFGLPPLEAMACGTPVVAADASALPEVLGDTAVYAEPTDTDAISRTIGELLMNDERREEMAHAGRSRAGEFTWDRTVKKTCEVLRSVV